MGERGRITRLPAVGSARVGVGVVLFFGVCSSLSHTSAQSVGSPAQVQANNSSELTSREAQPTFKIQAERNLVLVRVVVHDSKGQAVRNLRKEDFKLFDNGKAQTIAHFAVDVASAKPVKREGPGPERELDAEAQPEETLSSSTPQRYMALFFDDIHLNFEDVVRTREAADHYLAGALQPSDRVGVFTSSGQGDADFTDDRAKLQEALSRLRPRPVVQEEQDACPEIFDYQAYMMVHRRDPFAIEIAAQEAIQCDCEYTNNRTAQCAAEARIRAEAEAARVLNRFQTESEYALRGLEQLVRRISLVPGQRDIVLVSPGFLKVTEEFQVDEIVQRAVRSNVVINSLDAKGLFALIPLGDASRRPVVVARRADLVGQKAQMQLLRLEQAAEVLRDFASDTGGAFFHNSNDLDEGFRKVGAFPEVSYVLGFSPQNLKLDGRFHSLSVKMVQPAGLTLQARRGYFAPKKSVDAQAQTQEEIEQAIFSQDELHELPAEVHTQFFKLNESDARLSVVMHLDLRSLHFRKDEGRNLNNLTVVTALFDRDGKYLAAKEKRLDFHLRDKTLEQLLRIGLTMKTSFDVKPGTYLVREVVRDTEGGQLSGLSRTIEIPF